MEKPKYNVGDKVLCPVWASRGDRDKVCMVTAVKPYRTAAEKIAYTYEVVRPGWGMSNADAWDLIPVS